MVEIEDTYAEAFSGYYLEILVTARDEKWLMAAANSATGFATSSIGCGCEAGIDRILLEGTPLMAGLGQPCSPDFLHG